MAAASERNKGSITGKSSAIVAPYRIVKQGTESSDNYRQFSHAAAITDMPGGVSRGPSAAAASGDLFSVGDFGEFEVEVAAACVVGDQLIVDSVGGIGRVKPKGAAVAPYWVVGRCTGAQATIGSRCKLIYAPFYEAAASDDLSAADGHRQTIGPWTQANVAANQASVAISRGGTGAASGLKWIPTRAGSLVGISGFLETAGAAGSDLIVKVYKNGSIIDAATILTFDAAGTSTKERTTFTKDDYTFAAGDEIEVRVLSDGSWTATTADLSVDIEIET